MAKRLNGKGRGQMSTLIWLIDRIYGRAVLYLRRSYFFIRKHFILIRAYLVGKYRRAMRKRRAVPARPAVRRKIDLSNRRRISIVCFPKSGSTFISRSLCQFTGYPQVIISTSAEVQELSAHRFNRIDIETSFVAQTHCLPTKYALSMHEKHGLEPVFMYRNVMDCLISLRDMYVERVTTNEKIWEGGFTSQWGHYDKAFLALKPEEQYDYVIENALSWYLTFYASWAGKIHNEGYPVKTIRYEEFFADQNKNFLKLAKDLRLGDEQKLASFQLPEKKAGAEGVRFNVGRAGRGRELLSEAQQARIFKAAQVVEKGTRIDLSPILDPA